MGEAETARLAAWMNETPAIIVNVQKQPGANVIEVVDAVKKLLPQLTAALPASIETQLLTDRTTTIRASVKDTQFELMLAVVLVVAVIFVFLRSGTATLISAVASLTLTPMMSARLLKHTPPEKQGRFFRKTGEYFDRGIAKYGEGLRWVLDHQPLTMIVFLVTLALTAILYLVIPKGF